MNISPNIPTPDTNSYRIQAMTLYHYLTFGCGFTEIEANGSWPVALSGVNGIIANVQPSRFYAASATFSPSHVGMYIIVKDPVNPINTVVGKITNYISPTELQLNAPVISFGINASLVQYRIVDPAYAPVIGNYFVIENPATNQPKWQARFVVRSSSPLCLSVQFGPIGGWQTSTATWTLPVCDDVFLHATLVQYFIFADPTMGWIFLLQEETGGVGSARKGIWMGSLIPLHAPRITGLPSDFSYAAIFGDTTSTLVNNISRNSLITGQICTGQSMSENNTIIPIYWAQKRLLGDNTDVLTMSGANPNPRSSEADTYEVIAYHKEPKQAIRGRVPGMRILNDTITNRTLLINGTIYVVGGGVGVLWNKKDPV